MNDLFKTPNDPMDIDTQLVRAVQAGDITAFDGLVHQYKDRLFNVVYRFLGDYQEADECAQEIFIKVFKSIHTFRFESTFSTWIYRIAVNTCKNRIKSSGYRWKKKTVPIENAEGLKGDNPIPKIANGAPTPMAALEKKERWMRVQKAVNSLPEEQNRVVVLRDIQGLSYQEISDITGLSLGTVKSKLARARLALRDMLKSVINKSI
jgi:RNA polymerase sigma-70 factor (ECF subfamily)